MPAGGRRGTARSQAGRYGRRLRDRVRARAWRPRSSEGVGDPPPHEPVTIVVPIYDAFDDVARCLEALVRNTMGGASLLLIDDASPDPRITPLLARYAGHTNVEVLRNPENLGFTRTVNRGLEHTSGDVVLLNSDTEVTPGWLRRLALAAASDRRVGTVTAVSNNAGAFSVPDLAVDNPLPRGLSRDEVGRLVARTSLRIRPETPTANGFCMYVKRALVDDIAGLDADNFPRGYGEENDFSMRARDRGWRHLVDDSTFVHHRREASFGAEKADIHARALARVHDLHPGYEELVRAFVRSPAAAKMRTVVAGAFRGAAGPLRPRVLVVSGEDAGKAASAVAPTGRFEHLELASDRGGLRLLDGSAWGAAREWFIERPPPAGGDTAARWASAVGEALSRHDIDLVHLRAESDLGARLLEVARGLGIAWLSEPAAGAAGSSPRTGADLAALYDSRLAQARAFRPAESASSTGPAPASSRARRGPR